MSKTTLSGFAEKAVVDAYKKIEDTAMPMANHQMKLDKAEFELVRRLEYIYNWILTRDINLMWHSDDHELVRARSASDLAELGILGTVEKMLGKPSDFGRIRARGIGPFRTILQAMNLLDSHQRQVHLILEDFARDTLPLMPSIRETLRANVAAREELGKVLNDALHIRDSALRPA